MTLLVPVFLAALVGSAHCAAMCGAFACAAAGNPEEPLRVRAMAAYHATRLAGYALLGALAGSIGAGINGAFSVEFIRRPAAIAAGTVLLTWGLARSIGVLGIRVPTLPGLRADRWIAPMLRRGARSPISRGIVLGAVSPLLPCGWLWAFVAPAMAAGSAAGGALVMAAFWAGTVPALIALALGAQSALGPARRFVPAITAAAMVVVGAVTIVNAVREPATNATSSSHDHIGR